MATTALRDPDTGCQEKRKRLRKDIRHLVETVQNCVENEENTLDVNLIYQSNKLAEKIDRSREAAMDSELALLLANQGREAAEKLSVAGMTFSSQEFAARLRKLLNNGSTCLVADTLLQNLPDVSKLMDRSHVISKMPAIGSFRCEDLAEKKTRARNTTQQSQHREETIVKEISSMKDGELEEKTTIQVERLFKILEALRRKGETCIDYFEFVVDPHCFATTVENIFHCSFLIKQGLVRLILDEDGLATLELLDKPLSFDKSSQQYQEQSDESSGMTTIISLSMQEWREIIKTFTIKTSVIKAVEAQLARG